MQSSSKIYIETSSSESQTFAKVNIAWDMVIAASCMVGLHKNEEIKVDSRGKYLIVFTNHKIKAC